jgi:hypothetical protein
MITNLYTWYKKMRIMSLITENLEMEEAKEQLLYAIEVMFWLV